MGPMEDPMTAQPMEDSMKTQMGFEEAVDKAGEAMIDVIGRIRDNLAMGSADNDPLSRNAKLAASMNDLTQALLNLHELHEIVRSQKTSNGGTEDDERMADPTSGLLRPFI